MAEHVYGMHHIGITVPDINEAIAFFKAVFGAVEVVRTRSVAIDLQARLGVGFYSEDANDNGKADRAMGMMPKEGYGFSRDAPVKMAPPKFRDAVFAQGESTSRLTIKMRYLM